jgi:hypothetical protein
VNVNGGVVGSVDLRGTSTLNFSGGIVESYTLRENVTMNVSGTADIGSRVMCPDNVTLNISTGNNMYIDAFGTSSVKIGGGTYDTVTMIESSSIEVSDGSIESLNCMENVTASISGGTIGMLGAGGTIGMTGGEVMAMELRGAATLNMSGGTLGSYTLRESATMNVSGTADIGNWAECWGSSMLNISNGNNMTIMLQDESSAGISGGSYDAVNLCGASSLEVSCGSVSNVFLMGSSSAWISGGEIEEYISAIESSVISIYGYGFVYDELGGLWNGGTLSGYWMDDVAFSIDFLDDLGDSTYYDHVVLVPEPACAMLLGLGSVILLRKRKHSR